MDNPVNSQEITFFKGYHYVLSAFHYGASGDTVKVPLGCLSAAVLTQTGTAPSAVITAGSLADGVDSVALTGGTVNNSGCVMVSRHAGNPASAR